MDFHYIQLEILRELAINPNSIFSNLNQEGIGSNLIAYHLKKLITQKYVKKTNNSYALTIKGKGVVSTLDKWSVSPSIPKQGQNLVVCHVFTGKDFKSKAVINTRLKEPYYKYKGFLTNKIRFGETALEAARRSVKLETGLSGDFKYHGVIHFINKVDGEIVEDKYLYIFTILNASGDLIQDKGIITNELMTIDEYLKQNLIYPHEPKILDMILSGKNNFFETVYNLENF